MSTTALLKISDVRVAFGGLVAVNDVTLTAEPSELRAIIGPNGAGKTTLFNAIGGEVPLERGSVQIDGAELTGSPRIGCDGSVWPAPTRSRRSSEA